MTYWLLQDVEAYVRQGMEIYELKHRERLIHNIRKTSHLTRFSTDANTGIYTVGFLEA